MKAESHTDTVEAWAVVVRDMLAVAPVERRKDVLRLALANEEAKIKEREELGPLRAASFSDWSNNDWMESPGIRHWNTIMRLKSLVVDAFTRSITNNVTPALEEYDEQDFMRAEVEAEFIRMLKLSAKLGQKLSARPHASNYAAMVFAADPKCRYRNNAGRKLLAEAMDRLFERKVIGVARYGRPSDMLSQVVLLEGEHAT